jgi:PhnB protein
MKILPYLSFEGRAEEAIEFYKKALGAKVTFLMRFGEMPPPETDNPAEGCGEPNPDNAQKIGHASLDIGGNTVMLSDGMMQGPCKFQGVSLSIDAATEAEARKLFDALADGGQVQMPLGKTFWSPCFGMVADRFGLLWMVSIEEQPA